MVTEVVAAKSIKAGDSIRGSTLEFVLVVQVEAKGSLIHITTDKGSKWLRPSQGVQRRKS